MALLLGAPARGDAQEVEVRVAAVDGGVAVGGAITRLLDGGGNVIVERLTGEMGQALLPGRFGKGYRVRVDAIGFQRFDSPPFDLPPDGTVRIAVALRPSPFMLPDLKVSAEDRCSPRFREGSVGGLLWDEVAKALELTRFTQDNRLEPIRVTIFERLLDRHQAIIGERVVREVVTSGRPFVSLPAEDLARRGFVFKTDDSLTYAAPDAAVLLAEPFVRSHCYRVALPKGNDDPWVGLAFEPVRDRSVPDVEGVLWVDRKSAELRFLEFRYTDLEGLAAFTSVGGRVEFRRLPGGTWIVSDWYVRMPRVNHIKGDQNGVKFERDTLLGYVDRAGRAERAAVVPAVRVPAVLSGTLFDSLAMAPLVGAEVRVGGATEMVRSDSAGRFRLDVPEPGERVVTIRHPRLGLVADRSVQSVRFFAGREVAITAAVPAPGAFSGVFCPISERGEAGLLGIVLVDGTPASGVALQVSWPAPSRLDDTRRRGSDTRTGSRGIYALCALPAGPELRVEVVVGTRVIEVAKVTLAPGEFRWMDLVPPG